MKCTVSGEEPINELPLTDAQIKHMVDRFLMWKLPEGFNPDGGISFENTTYRQQNRPVGTSLFSATEADAMVRHMIEGLTERSHPEPDSDFRERIRLHPMARGCDLDTHNHILTATGAMLDEVGSRFGMQRLP